MIVKIKSGKQIEKVMYVKKLKEKLKGLNANFFTKNVNSSSAHLFANADDTITLIVDHKDSGKSISFCYNRPSDFSDASISEDVDFLKKCQQNSSKDLQNFKEQKRVQKMKEDF